MPVGCPRAARQDLRAVGRVLLPGGRVAHGQLRAVKKAKIVQIWPSNKGSPMPRSTNNRISSSTP